MGKATATEDQEDSGWDGFMEAYHDTLQDLAKAKRLGVFDHADVCRDFPDGDDIQPGVEVEVGRGLYFADIIRHRAPQEQGFIYRARKRTSRILHIAVCRKDRPDSEWVDLGTYDSDSPDERPQFMDEAQRDRGLRDFLKDVSQCLS